MKKIFLIIGLLTGIMFLGACGSENKSVISADPASGGDPHQAQSGWLPDGHAVAATSDLTPCYSCHASDLSGGISGVSCTSCHIGGPLLSMPDSYTLTLGTLSIVYPWMPGGHGLYTTKNTTSSCANQYCHGTDLNGVANSGQSCITFCHIGGAILAMPASWSTPADLKLPLPSHGAYVNANGSGSCRNIYCHGADLSGVSGSGPTCYSSKCHPGVVFN